MALDRSSYADFVISELRSVDPGGRLTLERISGSRVRVEFEQDGFIKRFRLLLFAVGESGRSRSLERRVEITSTYAGRNLRPLAGHLDLVLGLERDRRLIVGLDRRRLNTGGDEHNASTFVYIPSFDKLVLAPYIIFENDRQRLFPIEYQVYMRPEFLITYLAEEHTLHASGLRMLAPSLTSDKLASDLDKNFSSGSNQRLDYEQQVQLALKKMQIGQLGERVVLDSECKRLTDEKRKDLSNKVSWISQTKPFLGYDIISYDRKAKTEYVEVKTSSSTLRAFYFTANEMRQAKRLADSYRLVCVSNVMRRPSLVEYRNPIRAIERGELIVEHDTSLVRIK